MGKRVLVLVGTTNNAIGPLHDGETPIDVEISNEMDEVKHGLYTAGGPGENPCVTVNGTLARFPFDWTMWHELGHHIIDTDDLRIQHDDMDILMRHVTRILHNSPRLCEYFYRLHFPEKRKRK